MLFDASNTGKRGAITHYLMLAIGLHAGLLATPLARHVSNTDIPTHSTLQAKFQNLPRSIEAQPASANRNEPPPEKRLQKHKKQAEVLSHRIVENRTTALQTQPTTASEERSSPEIKANLRSDSTAVAPISTPRFDAAYLKNPGPAYPALSRRQNESGKVLLKVRVSPEGHPVAVDLAQSSNFTRLDEAARQAVSRWHFIPAKQGDQPMTAEVIVPVVFLLED